MTTLTNTEKLRLTGGLYVGRRARKHSYDLKLLRYECLRRIFGLALANNIKVAKADKIDTESFPLTAASLPAALSEASRCGIETC